MSFFQWAADTYVLHVFMVCFTVVFVVELISAKLWSVRVFINGWLQMTRDIYTDYEKRRAAQEEVHRKEVIRILGGNK